MKADVVIETLGLFCPVPIIKTSQAMKTIDAGGVVEVISDDPAIEFDMPAWCKSHGHKIISVEKEGKTYRYFVEKRGK